MEPDRFLYFTWVLDFEACLDFEKPRNLDLLLDFLFPLGLDRSWDFVRALGLERSLDSNLILDLDRFMEFKSSLISSRPPRWEAVPREWSLPHKESFELGDFSWSDEESGWISLF